MRNRQQLWMLIAVFAVAAALRIGIIGRSGLWADEVFSLAIATGHSLEQPAAISDPKLGDFVEPEQPVQAEEFRRYLKHDDPPAGPARIIRAVLLSDTSPPLYYLLLYLWTLVFGTTDFALRLFSTACSLACLPWLAGIARRTAGEGAVAPACVLFALSPLAIYYSTEGRMYSLLWLCVVVVTWASLVLHQNGGSIAVYLLWVAASVAGFLTHYFFVFPWLAIIALLVIRPGNLTRKHFFSLLLLVSLILLPWYIRIPQSLHSWRITQSWLNWRPGHFNRPSAALELVLQFFSGTSNQLWSGHRTSKAIALILFSLVALAMLWRLRTRALDWSRLLLALPFAAACAGPLVFDLFQHTYTVAVPRYAIAGLPAACLLAALGLTCLQPRVKNTILVLIIVAWAPNVLSIYRTRSRSGSAIREISRAATTNASPSDLILVHSIPSGVLGVARYAQGPAAFASWVGQLGNRRVPQSLLALTAGRTRILFVKVHEVGEPAPEENWLRTNAVVFHEKRFGSAQAIDFRPGDSETF